MVSRVNFSLFPQVHDHYQEWVAKFPWYRVSSVSSRPSRKKQFVRETLKGFLVSDLFKQKIKCP